MEVVEVERAARRAIEEVRRGGAPFFLECRTYRFRAHSMYDPELYRSREEVEEWKKRDPVLNFAARLQENGALDPDSDATRQREFAQELADAVEFAERGTWEPLADLTRHVYAQEPR